MGVFPDVPLVVFYLSLPIKYDVQQVWDKRNVRAFFWFSFISPSGATLSGSHISQCDDRLGASVYWREARCFLRFSLHRARRSAGVGQTECASLFCFRSLAHVALR